MTKKLLSIIYLNLLCWNRWVQTQLWHLMVQKKMSRSLTDCFSSLHHSNSRQIRDPTSTLGSNRELTDVGQSWVLMQKHHGQLPCESRVRSLQYTPLGCGWWIEKTLCSEACYGARIPRAHAQHWFALRLLQEGLNTAWLEECSSRHRCLKKNQTLSNKVLFSCEILV